MVKNPKRTVVIAVPAGPKKEALDVGNAEDDMSAPANPSINPADDQSGPSAATRANPALAPKTGFKKGGKVKPRGVGCAVKGHGKGRVC